MAFGNIDISSLLPLQYIPLVAELLLHTHSRPCIKSGKSMEKNLKLDVPIFMFNFTFTSLR